MVSPLAGQDISSVLHHSKSRIDAENEKTGEDLDWKFAQEANTFESYQAFRLMYPESQYDKIASDNMAKRLADNFTFYSTYADREEAESYAKREMTRDYVANKWKAAMAKKPTSSSYFYSYSSTNSYESSSNSYGSSSYHSTKTIPDKSKFAIGIEGTLDGLENSLSSSWGLSMRIGAFNSLFNLIIGAKYQYSTTYDEYHYYSDFDYSYWEGYTYDYHSAWHKHTASQFMIPVIINWNVARTKDFAYYLGIGYEQGVVISQKHNYRPTDDGFNYNEYIYHEDYQPARQLSLPSQNVVIQTGFAGRHWDGKLYYKIYTNSNTYLAADPGTLGMALSYYF